MVVATNLPRWALQIPSATGLTETAAILASGAGVVRHTGAAPTLAVGGVAELIHGTLGVVAAAWQALAIGAAGAFGTVQMLAALTGLFALSAHLVIADEGAAALVCATFTIGLRDFPFPAAVIDAIRPRWTVGVLATGPWQTGFAPTLVRAALFGAVAVPIALADGARVYDDLTLAGKAVGLDGVEARREALGAAGWFDVAGEGLDLALTEVTTIGATGGALSTRALGGSDVGAVRGSATSG